MDYPTGYGKRPKWQWVVLYLVIGGLIYAAVYYFFFMNKGGRATPYGAAYNPQVAQTAGQTTITVTAAGFQPGSVTIKAGDTVIWNNQNGVAISVNSDPHPSHTDYPPLNLGLVNNGATTSLTFSTAGTYKYHNHLNPSQFGSITVQ